MTPGVDVRGICIAKMQEVLGLPQRDLRYAVKGRV